MLFSKHYRVGPKRSIVFLDISLLILTVVLLLSCQMVSTEKKETEDIILSQLQEVNKRLVVKEDLVIKSYPSKTLLSIRE